PGHRARRAGFRGTPYGDADRGRSIGRRPCYGMLSSVTSKTSVAFGGIVLADGVLLPYASAGGMIRRRFPPTFIPTIPWSQPAITVPAPSVNAFAFLECNTTEAQRLRGRNHAPSLLRVRGVLGG